MLFDTAGITEVSRNERLPRRYRAQGSQQEKRVYKDFYILRKRHPIDRVTIVGGQIVSAAGAGIMVGGGSALGAAILTWEVGSYFDPIKVGDAALGSYAIGLTGASVLAVSFLGSEAYGEYNYIGSGAGVVAGLGAGTLTMLAARQYSSDANMPILFLLASAMPATGSLIGYHLELKYKRKKREPSPVETSVQAFGNRLGLTMTF